MTRASIKNTCIPGPGYMLQGIVELIKDVLNHLECSGNLVFFLEEENESHDILH